MRPSPPFELVQASLEAHSPPCKVGARGAARPRARAARCACGPSGLYNETVPQTRRFHGLFGSLAFWSHATRFRNNARVLTDQLAGAACMHAWKTVSSAFLPHTRPPQPPEQACCSPPRRRPTSGGGPSCAAHTYTSKTHDNS